MESLSHGRIIGIDVNRDWLDVHCLPDGQRLRLTNNDGDHAIVAKLAREREAIVCFEATGGLEWKLWSVLAGVGVETRQVAPA
ncbi:hypothetical protein EDD52_1081, partial [Primorskyibacter sedentarius]